MEAVSAVLCARVVMVVCVALQVRRSTHQLYWYYGCHPAKMYLLPWIQLPLWLTLSLALRNMSGAWPGSPPNCRHLHALLYEAVFVDVPNCSSSRADAVALHVELASGGVGWFHDLTAADPCLALPFVLVVANLLNIEVRDKWLPLGVCIFLYPPSPPLPHANTRCMQCASECNPKDRSCFPNSSDTSRLEWVSLLLSSLQYVCKHACLPPLPHSPSSLPQAMSLYWASSSVFGLLQNALLKVPRVRRSLRVPKTPSEHAQPFQAILRAWQQRAETFLQHQKRHQ